MKPPSHRSSIRVRADPPRGHSRKMDPIQPIPPGPLPGIARVDRSPVERPERVSRERDRPPREGEERKRRDTPSESAEPPHPEDEHLHIDVRA